MILPHYAMDAGTLRRLVELMDRGELTKGMRVTFRRPEGMIEEVVKDVRLTHFEMMRYAIDGRTMDSIPEFLYNPNGCFHMETHRLGTREYHSLFEQTKPETQHA